MGVAPTPDEIYGRAEQEGERRLSMTAMDKTATGFIAGVTIVFGIIALGVTAALVEAAVGRELATLAGALAFSLGLVFVVVGRAELFSENFFDPVAAAIKEGGTAVFGRLVGLWLSILALNMVGGAVMVAITLVDGALPHGATDVLVRVAEEIAAKEWPATLARAVIAGALITLLSYLTKAVDTGVARILLAVMVGFFLAVGPFDHVVVSGLHLLFGIWHSGAVGYADLWTNLGLSAAGNLVGGLLLITLTHTAQTGGR